jgi:AcrR family transcriptional regulator
MTKDKIDTVATQLIIEQGAAGTTFSEVARRAGVAEPTVYMHYPNKQALLSAALEKAQEVRAFIEHVAARPAQEDPLASIAHAFTQSMTQLSPDELDRRMRMDQAIAEDPLLTGIAHRSDELLTQRVAEALQRRAGAAIGWDDAVLSSYLFRAVVDAASQIQRKDAQWSDFAAEIERLLARVRPEGPSASVAKSRSKRT